MKGKTILGWTVAAVSVITYAVHYQQEYDKKEMKKGIKRDLERMKQKALSKN